MIFTLLLTLTTPVHTCVCHSRHTHVHLHLSFILTFFFFPSLSTTQKLGGRTVSDSAHRIVIRPGSCRGPHGPPGSLQGRVRGGARRHALARQATHPPGNQRAPHRYTKQPNTIFHSSEMIFLTVVCCFGFSVRSLASSVKMIHRPSDCLNLCASTHR